MGKRERNWILNRKRKKRVGGGTERKKTKRGGGREWPNVQEMAKRAENCNGTETDPGDTSRSPKLRVNLMDLLFAYYLLEKSATNAKWRGMEWDRRIAFHRLRTEGGKGRGRRQKQKEIRRFGGGGEGQKTPPKIREKLIVIIIVGIGGRFAGSSGIYSLILGAEKCQNPTKP